MTPLGHASVGYLLSAPWARASVPALVIGALLPDIDFLLVWSQDFNQWHRTATHSLLFVAVAAVVAGASARAGRRWAVALSLAAGGVSHLLLDSCLDANPSNGIGVALAWPFVLEPISWVNFLDPHDGAPSWTKPTRMLAEGWRWLVLDTLVALSAGIVWARRRSRSGRADPGLAPRSRS